uniref:F-box domain-containing protein n=1 Tax=Meloidogyne incognita TaxID=6306 RepID=A0A914LK86_MELIC
MNSLPPEVQLDVLKCLNFDQLFSVKQTNCYFNKFIDKYEDKLPRLKFNKLNIISVGDIKRDVDVNTFELDSFPKFILNDQLKEKWQEAIAKSVSLYLQDYGGGKLFAVELEKTYCDLKKKKLWRWILHLPNFSKNITEMIVVRWWLKRLFNCFFEYTDFKNLFNPEMIKLLFENDQSIPQQFHIQKPSLNFDRYTYTLENALKFALNHLAISESLRIDFDDNILEQQIDILFNILMNESNKFPQFYLKGFKCFEMSRLYDLIFEHLSTAEDCSKIVPVIMLEYISELNFELNEKAENVEIKEFNGVKYTKYHVTNEHNSNLKFSFCNAEFKGPTNFIFKLRIMKM